VLPLFAVSAGFACWWLAGLARERAPYVMILLCASGAVPAASGSISWDRFLAQDDTRTRAGAMIERQVPADTTILVQPYSVPLRQSREALAEALRLKLGDPARAPLKYRLQLGAKPRSGPAYRLLYLGASGKTGAPPADVDKIYISPRAFTANVGLTPLRQARVQFVVLTRYGPTAAAIVPLETALQRGARQIARFSPYREGVTADAATVPPFRHNANTWIDPALERPGPIVEIWRVP
jgi:hypothetical protein